MGGLRGLVLDGNWEDCLWHVWFCKSIISMLAFLSVPVIIVFCSFIQILFLYGKKKNSFLAFVSDRKKRNLLGFSNE